MAILIMDDLWLCIDCTIVACNDNWSGVAIDPEEIQRGLAALALVGYLTADFDSNTGEGMDEFSSRRCDCCRSRLAGSRHRFSLLGPGQPTLLES